MAEDDAADFGEKTGRAQLDEPLVDERHRVPHLLEKEDGVGGIDFVRGADGLLHEGGIAADQPARGAAGPYGTRRIATDLRRRARCGERGEE